MFVLGFTIMFTLLHHFDWTVQLKPVNQLEPPHDKTNEMTVRPAKTQISLGTCPD